MEETCQNCQGSGFEPYDGMGCQDCGGSGIMDILDERKVRIDSDLLDYLNPPQEER